MRIGELLIMNGLLNEKQLNEALQEQAQEQPPRKLGEILIARGFVTERQLVEALEFQLGVPVANLGGALEETAAALVPGALARKYMLFPLGRSSGNKLKLAMADPANREAIREVEAATGLQVKPFIAAPSEVEQVIARTYEPEAQERPLQEILKAGLDMKASYIHIDPSEEGLAVKARVDKQIRLLQTLPEGKGRLLLEELKRLSGLVAHPAAAYPPAPRFGRFNYSPEDGPKTHIHVSALPGAAGESLVLRLIAESEYAQKLSELDLSEAQLQRLEQTLEEPSGMILVAGPPGSGRSTMLYAFMHHLIGEHRRIISLEDPVERPVSGTIQLEIQEQKGLTFEDVLRSSLRHDPNVVIIGNMRSQESAAVAARAANSGILVAAGIRGSDVLQVLGNLGDWSTDPIQSASAVKAVVSRRLLRRVCKQCAQSVPVADEDLSLFEEAGLLPSEDQKNGGAGNKSLFGNFRSIVSAQIAGKMTVLRGNGCRLCNDTGYRGVVAVHEVLKIDEPLRRLLLEGRPPAEIRQHVEQSGFKTLRYDALKKVREGLTTVEEVRKAGL